MPWAAVASKLKRQPCCWRQNKHASKLDVVRCVLWALELQPNHSTNHQLRSSAMLAGLHKPTGSDSPFVKRLLWVLTLQCGCNLWPCPTFYVLVRYHSQQWCHSKSPSVCGSNLHCIRRWMLRWRRSWCKEGRRWHLDHLKQKRMAQLIQLGLIPRNPTWMPALRGKRRMRLRASRTVLSRLSLFHDSWDITLFNRRKFKRFEMKLSDGDVTWFADFFVWQCLTFFQFDMIYMA